jgi:heme exporter protein A
LQFWADFLGTGAAAIGEPLARVGLETLADLPAAYLSAGQRRRLSIARLLVVTRPIWLLDEPLSALDAVAQQSLTEFMRAHLAGGGVILAATHGALGLSAVREVWLGEAPSPLVGEGWGGGSGGGATTSTPARRVANPTPTPSPSGKGEET